MAGQARRAAEVSPEIGRPHRQPAVPLGHGRLRRRRRSTGVPLPRFLFEAAVLLRLLLNRGVVLRHEARRVGALLLAWRRQVDDLTRWVDRFLLLASLLAWRSSSASRDRRRSRAPPPRRPCRRRSTGLGHHPSDRAPDRRCAGRRDKGRCRAATRSRRAAPPRSRSRSDPAPAPTTLVCGSLRPSAPGLEPRWLVTRISQPHPASQM